jgi:phosphoribosylformylglycinamidine cyclo-ligase
MVWFINKVFLHPRYVDCFAIMINLDSYRILEIFQVIKKESKLTDDEMLRTFNMGIGLCIVCAPDQVKDNISHLQKFNEEAYVIGNIVPGKGIVQCQGKIRYIFSIKI